jgi:hypothetical protein
VTSPLIDENALLRRIEGIERQLRELGPSIAKSFGSTVAALTTTVSNLEDAVADIADLAAHQIAVDQDQDLNTGVAMTTSLTTRATATLTVPSGYDQAVVFAFGSIYGINNSGSVDMCGIDIYIAGTGSGQVWPSPNTPNFYTGVASASFSRTLSGLTGGGSITVQSRIQTNLAAWTSGGVASVQAVGIFFKS